MSDILIKAEHVSKKFCRSLKRSLWYGVKDVSHSLNPWARDQEIHENGDSFQPKQLRPDEFWALQDVSFEVRRGECLGLIGHNGAGKSTLLKTLNGLIRPDSGRISMRGRVGAMIELGAGFNPILTGRENIFNQAALLGFPVQEVRKRFDEIVEFAEVAHAIDMPLQNYSSGMRVRLGFSVFAHLEPDVLLIDEVLAVGDVSFRLKCLNRMVDLLNRCAVIFVTHAMPQVFRVCSDVLLMDHGKPSYQGSDIAVGVTKYFAALPENAQSVAGSGEAKLTSLVATAGSERCTLGQTLSMQFSQQLQLQLELKLLPPSAGGRVQLVLWSSELLPVLASMTEELDGFPFIVNEDGFATVTVKLCRLCLNAGVYNVSVVVLSDNRKVLCRHDGAVAINMSTNCGGGAYVIQIADWTQN